MRSMSYLVSLLLVCILSSEFTLAQKADLSDEEGNRFFREQMSYLIKDGGTWLAENPDYDENKQYAARSFKYEITSGIHGDHFRIRILSDIKGLGWWISWDGYYLWDPVNKIPIYHSLGGGGASVSGVLQVLDDTERVNTFKVTSYQGIISSHKDVTKKISENEMHSESYILNENGEWMYNQKLVWRRRL